MNNVKLISLAGLLFILDTLVWGSILGLMLVFAYWVSDLLSDTDTNLIHAYFTGIVYYLFFDTIAAKFREHYKDAIEFFKKDNT